MQQQALQHPVSASWRRVGNRRLPIICHNRQCCLISGKSKSKVGCFIGAIFTGALAYADDIVLCTLSATALRKMLVICDKHASDFDMAFSDSMRRNPSV